MTSSNAAGELRFDGQVAIVTGAGRGLGREYALALGHRGCRVVVVDVGCDLNGAGRDPSVAEGVAREITDAGGIACSRCVDVTEPGAAEELIAYAVDVFGRLDVVVNNVGGSRMYLATTVLDRTLEDIEFTIRGNLWSAILMCRAAWPLFENQRSGRIVNISSGSAFGMIPAFDYAAAKAGVIGLTRSFALAGEAIGVKVNAVMPNALTRAVERNIRDEKLLEYAAEQLAPKLGAPIVTLLSHNDCPVNGETFSAAGRIVSRVVLGDTEGVLFDELTPESILADIESVLDSRRVTYFSRAEEQVASYVRRFEHATSPQEPLPPPVGSEVG